MTGDRDAEPLSDAERARRYRARKRAQEHGEEIPETSWNRKMTPGPKPKPKPQPCPVDCRDDMPMDRLAPARHVATELEKAGTKGLSVIELAATYMHPNTGDINRVKIAHGCVTNDEVNRYMIDRAIRELGSGLRLARSTNTMLRIRLAVPFEELRHPAYGALHRLDARTGLVNNHGYA